jgi:hypothetical protein
VFGGATGLAGAELSGVRVASAPEGVQWAWPPAWRVEQTADGWQTLRLAGAEKGHEVSSGETGPGRGAGGWHKAPYQASLPAETAEIALSRRVYPAMFEPNPTVPRYPRPLSAVFRPHPHDHFLATTSGGGVTKVVMADLKGKVVRTLAEGPTKEFDDVTVWLTAR